MKNSKMFFKTDLKCIIWLQLEGTQPMNSGETLALTVWMIWMVLVSLVLKSTQKIMAKMVLFATPNIFINFPRSKY